MTIASALWARVQDEPVATQGVVQALLALFISYGLNCNSQQEGAFLAATAMLLTWLTRKVVTPTSKTDDA